MTSTESRLSRALNIGIVATFVALIGVIIFLYDKGEKAQDKYDEQISMNDVLNDTLQIYKDKDGKNHTRISQFQTQHTKDFLALKTSNQSVQFLQAQVKKYEKQLGERGSVTTIQTQSVYQTTVPTEVKKTADPTSPIYIGDSKDKFGKWARITSIATKDSTTYDLQTNSNFTFVLGREKTGFLGLGKGKPFVDATDENPYTKIKDLRSYQVSENYKRWVIGIGGTAGATYLQNRVGLGFTFGLTATYKFLEF